MASTKAQARPGVLVTGGAGYIGSHAVLALRERGAPVVVLDNLCTGFREAVPSGVVFYPGDVSDAPLVTDILKDRKIGAVLHFAGSLSVPESVAEPAKYYTNNTAASLSLAKTCIAGGVERFIFSSTASVYGATLASPIAEDAPKAPLSPYGASKLMTETILRDLSRAHPAFKVLILRYFNVGGADPKGRSGLRDPNAAGLIRLAMETALGRRDALDITGDDFETRDGTGERDYIHVTDLAEAHVAGLDYLAAGGEGATLNCGYGRGFTVKEVLATLERVLGRPVPSRIAPRRPGDPASAVSDVSRLKATLPWRPRLDDLETILQTAYDWQASLAEATQAGRPPAGAKSLVPPSAS